MARVSGKEVLRKERKKSQVENAKGSNGVIDINKIWMPQAGPQLMANTCPVDIILFGGSRGGGKMLSNDSKILTPKGWKTHGDICVGDAVTDPETGGSQRVIGVYPQGEMDLYRVTFDDGASVLAGLEHLWAYKMPNRLRPRSKASSQREYLHRIFGRDYSASGRYANFRVGKTSELISELSSGSSPRIPLTAPVLFDVNGRVGTSGLDPYLVGLMLGDGTFRSGKTDSSGFCLVAADIETQEYISGLGFRQSGQNPISWYLGAGYGDGVTWRLLRSFGANHGLLGVSGASKFIPSFVFTSGVEYRLGILQGLLDSDGYVDERGHIEFSNISHDLCKGVADIVRSFGGKATISGPFVGKYRDSFGAVVECQQYWRVYIWSDNSSSFFRLTRKKERCVDSWNGGYENMRRVVSIEFEKRGLATCIQVSSPHGLYVTDDYIVTHNTDCALGRQIIRALLYGTAWNGLFIRKSYKYFAELRRRITSLINIGLPAELVGSSQGTNYLRFDNGAIITLTVVESIEKAEFFQGQQFTEISIEEGCQFGFFLQMLEMLKGCMRSPHGIKTTIFVTANPGGAGHSSVKNTFMPKGTVPMKPFFDDAGLSYVFIPSSVEDNKILCANDPRYVMILKSIKDPALRKAWLEGDWDVVLGGFFGDLWNNYKHVVNNFIPPRHWPRIVSMDWGSSTPFSIGYHAVSDGTTVIPECGDKVFPRGAIIRYHEWYGCPKGEVNKGLRLDSGVVAERMLERERHYGLLDGAIDVDRVADPSIFSVKDGPSTAENMAMKGVVWRKGDNNRIAGWNMMRGLLAGQTIERLYESIFKKDGSLEHNMISEIREPMFYACRSCSDFIRTFPELQRDEKNYEDVDTDGEDHAADDARYCVMSRPNMPIDVHVDNVQSSRRDGLLSRLHEDNGAIRDLDGLSSIVTLDNGDYRI